MNSKFHTLPIAAKFHEPIRWTTAKPAYMVYLKVSKSAGKCVEQVNMSNTRHIGGIFKFAPQCVVVEVE